MSTFDGFDIYSLSVTRGLGVDFRRCGNIGIAVSKNIEGVKMTITVMFHNLQTP